MAGTPDSIGQIHISVSDLDRAVAWYRDVLGLEFLFQVPGQAMAFFNCGGVRLYLGIPENETFRSQPILYYGWAGSKRRRGRSRRAEASFPTSPMSCTGMDCMNSG